MYLRKFSIIVPVYNSEQYLAQCINSVIEQNYSNFELLLVDDGSTDRSGAICDDYAQSDNRIQCIHQLNQGALQTRLNAIKFISGDYCLYLDSDDYWEPNLLNTANQIISEYQAELVLFNFNFVNLNGEFLSVKKSIAADYQVYDEHNQTELIKILASSSVLNSMCNKVIKRELLSETQTSYGKTLKNCEDLLQSIPIVFNSSRTVSINQALYNYRVVPGSASRTLRPEYHLETSFVKTEMLNYIRRFNLKSEELLQALYTKYLDTILNHLTDVFSSTLDENEKRRILKEISTIDIFQKAHQYLGFRHYSVLGSIKMALIDRNMFLTLKTITQIERWLKTGSK